MSFDILITENIFVIMIFISMIIILLFILFIDIHSKFIMILPMIFILFIIIFFVYLINDTFAPVQDFSKEQFCINEGGQYIKPDWSNNHALCGFEYMETESTGIYSLYVIMDIKSKISQRYCFQCWDSLCYEFDVLAKIDNGTRRNWC